MIRFKLIFMIMIMMLVPLFISAQDDSDLDDLGFDETEYSEESTPYFGIGGGFILSMFLPDFTEINNFAELHKYDMDDELDGMVYLLGGEGFTVSFLVDNLRIALYSMGGSQIIEKSFTNFNNSGRDITRRIEYGVVQTGLSLDYAIIIWNSVALLPGIGAGLGKVNINTYQGDDNGSWIVDPFEDQYLQMNTMQSNMIFVQPRLNFEIALTEIVTFRIGASYNLSFMSDWELNKSGKISNVPDKVNASGLGIQTGLFLGLFNY